MSEPFTPSFIPPGHRAERGFPRAALGIAGLVTAMILGALLAFGGHHRAAKANQPQPLDPYASNLPLTQLAMSESTSLSGGKSTFLDGHVNNKGSQIVTAITVQVFFKNEEGMPPHVETVPLALVRTRQPYVDTEPVSAAPLAPGDDREFRLIFESIPDNWNTQLPEVHIVHVARK